MARIRLKEDEKHQRRQLIIEAAPRLPARGGAYDEAFAEIGRNCCLAFGATDEELATFFGVNASTVGEWKVKHPEFALATYEGKAVADAKVVASLYKRALGFRETLQEVHKDKVGVSRAIEIERYFPPDTTACIFWLKNRQYDDWRDRVDPSTQVNNLTNIRFESLSDQQLDIVIQRLTEELRG